MNKFTFVIFIFLSLLIFLSLDNRLSLTGDNAIYTILAHSIVSGRGYRKTARQKEAGLSGN